VFRRFLGVGMGGFMSYEYLYNDDFGLQNGVLEILVLHSFIEFGTYDLSKSETGSI
jgi:hypothetical protein